MSASWKGRFTVRLLHASLLYFMLFRCIFPSQSWMLHICQKHTFQITLHKLLLQVCIEFFFSPVWTFVNDALDIACNHTSCDHLCVFMYLYYKMILFVHQYYFYPINWWIDEAHLHPMCCNFSFRSTKMTKTMDANNSTSAVNWKMKWGGRGGMHTDIIWSKRWRKIPYGKVTFLKCVGKNAKKKFIKLAVLREKIKKHKKKPI